MAQVHKQRLPAYIPACPSQGEASWELNWHLQPSASTEEARQRARPRSPLLGEGSCELTLIVTAAAVTELLILPDGGLAKLVRQRHELLNVLR